MILQSFLLLLPILLLVLLGLLLSRRHELSGDTLVRAITEVLMPMLIFHALATSDIELTLVANLAGVTSFVVLAAALVAWLYARLAGIGAREFIPPVIFMNSGFLGIPLMQLWGGLAAVNLVVIYDQIQTLYIFTLGLAIITGGMTAGRLIGLREMLKAPILWSIVLGFLFRFSGLELPPPVAVALDFGGSAAPPLAAFALGVALGTTKFHFSRHLFAALGLRFVGGFLLALAGCEIFGVTGLSRTVVLVASALPSAVFTSVLPLRYGAKADFGGTMVVVSSVLGVLVIPLSFWAAALLS